jgi:hypothetical protein
VYTEQVMSGNLVCQVFVLFKGGYNLQFIDKMVQKKSPIEITIDAPIFDHEIGKI